MITDAHTHNLTSTNGIISIGPDNVIDPRRLYSIGLHPWYLTEQSTIDSIRNAAENPAVVAIGETGLDRLQGAPFDLQMQLLRDHISLSEQLRKPLILHSVRTHEDLIALRRNLRPSQPWIIHGFRGKPAVAKRLLDAGFHISLGPRFNPQTATLIPANRLLLETDDDPSATIVDTATAIAPLRHTTSAELLTQSSLLLTTLMLPKKNKSISDYSNEII